MAVAALLPAWTAADAQASRDIRVRVGVGAQSLPKFVGADSSRISPLFHINLARGAKEFSFSAPDDRPGISLVSVRGVEFGPAGDIETRRKPSDVGAPVDPVGRTFDVGAFAQYEWTDSFRVRGELVKGVNGHKGLVGMAGVDKIWRDGDKYVVSLGPRVLFSDGRYQRAYFGVSPAASLATGLPVYAPHGGVYAVALASGLTYSLGRRWGLFGFARYERLVGHAADSPLIRRFGSRDQLSGGIGLNYKFTIRRGPRTP